MTQCQRINILLRWYATMLTQFCVCFVIFHFGFGHVFLKFPSHIHIQRHQRSTQIQWARSVRLKAEKQKILCPNTQIVNQMVSLFMCFVLLLFYFIFLLYSFQFIWCDFPYYELTIWFRLQTRKMLYRVVFSYTHHFHRTKGAEYANFIGHTAHRDKHKRERRWWLKPEREVSIHKRI